MEGKGREGRIEKRKGGEMREDVILYFPSKSFQHWKIWFIKREGNSIPLIHFPSLTPSNIQTRVHEFLTFSFLPLPAYYTIQHTGSVLSGHKQNILKSERFMLSYCKELSHSGLFGVSSMTSYLSFQLSTI